MSRGSAVGAVPARAAGAVGVARTRTARARSFVAAAAVGATGAFFSDSETSTGNTFTAGAIVYPTLYLIGWVSFAHTGSLCLAVMVPTSTLTCWVAYQTWKANR